MDLKSNFANNLTFRLFNGIAPFLVLPLVMSKVGTAAAATWLAFVAAVRLFQIFDISFSATAVRYLSRYKGEGGLRFTEDFLQIRPFVLSFFFLGLLAAISFALYAGFALSLDGSESVLFIGALYILVEFSLKIVKVDNALRGKPYLSILPSLCASYSLLLILATSNKIEVIFELLACFLTLSLFYEIILAVVLLYLRHRKHDRHALTVRGMPPKTDVKTILSEISLTSLVPISNALLRGGILFSIEKIVDEDLKIWLLLSYTIYYFLIPLGNFAAPLSSPIFSRYRDNKDLTEIKRKLFALLKSSNLGALIFISAFLLLGDLILELWLGNGDLSQNGLESLKQMLIYLFMSLPFVFLANLLRNMQYALGHIKSSVSLEVVVSGIAFFALILGDYFLVNLDSRFIILVLITTQIMRGLFSTFTVSVIHVQPIFLTVLIAPLFLALFTYLINDHLYGEFLYGVSALTCLISLVYFFRTKQTVA